MSAQLEKRYFNVDEYYRMARAGVLKPDDRVELITSVLADRHIRIPLYARSLIPEVWLVNLPKKIIETYFNPGEGSYSKSRRYKRGDTVVAHSVPGLKFEVKDILG